MIYNQLSTSFNDVVSQQGQYQQATIYIDLPDTNINKLLLFLELAY